MIEAKDLTKRYEDGVLALDALNLRVGPGCIYCLLGANGAGKTTTINLFLNFIEPTAGEARIHGVDVSRDPLEAKRHIAYLSENVMLYGNFTARQNLSFFARLAGRDGLGHEDLHAVMRKVGLPERSFEQRVREFSKGMRQKLGIAICMVKDAPALIMDEPMSGLDPKAAAELVDTLRELRDSSKAILISTHDVFRAKEMADIVGIMNEGRKVMERTRDELVQEDLEQLYLGYMRGGIGSAPRGSDPMA
jgi:ABC-2 type transport system ATP-binding protein